MKKIISLLTCLAIVLSALFLASCKNNKVYYFDNSSVSADKVHKQHGVIVDKTNFPDDVEIVVTKIKEKDRRYKLALKVIPEAAELHLYDISALRNGVTIQPYGPVNVKFPVPTTYKEEKFELDIYHITNTGAAEYVDSYMNKKGIDVVLDHFSLYAVVLFKKPEDTTDGTSSDITGNSSKSPVVVAPPVSSNTEFVGGNIEMDMSEGSSQTKPVTSNKPTSSKPTSSVNQTIPDNPRNDGYTNDYVIS
jgi:hypothetical protein